MGKYKIGFIFVRKYKVISDIIGQGGNGSVYEVEDIVNGTKDLCLKILKKPNIIKKRRRFIKEIRKMKLIYAQGIDIVPILDNSYRGKNCWYVMPKYSPFRELYMGKSVLEKINLFTNLVDVLIKIHELGYAHRDIKSSNILVNSNGVPLFCDFGLIKHINDVDNISSDNEVVGPKGLIIDDPEEIYEDVTLQARDVQLMGKLLWSILTEEEVSLTGSYDIVSGRYRLSNYTTLSNVKNIRILEWLLFYSTHQLAGSRPTIVEFSEELRSWIDSLYDLKVENKHKLQNVFFEKGISGENLVRYVNEVSECVDIVKRVADNKFLLFKYLNDEKVSECEFIDIQLVDERKMIISIFMKIEDGLIREEYTFLGMYWSLEHIEIKVRSLKRSNFEFSNLFEEVTKNTPLDCDTLKLKA